MHVIECVKPLVAFAAVQGSIEMGQFLLRDLYIDFATTAVPLLLSTPA